MALLARWLAADGFDVRVFSCATVNQSLKQNAERLNRFAESIAGDIVHFVGHSLGGALVLSLFHYYPQARPGRIVTLAAPHGGSQVARRLSRYPWTQKILGKGVAQIRTGALYALAPADRDVGTISGNVSIGLGRFISHLDGSNDGILTIAETCLAGACDAMTIPVSHSGMLFSRTAAAQTAHFLKTGRFRR